MKKLAILLCLMIFGANAQEAMHSEMSDNDKVTNGKGDDKLSNTPIGLDLMGGNKRGVTVFPSSDNDHILISVAGQAKEQRSIRIADSNGQPVFKMENRRENTFLVDSSGLKKGIYIIEVVSGTAVYRKKWAKS